MIIKIQRLDLRKLSDTALGATWNKLNHAITSFWTAGIIPELGAYGGQAILKTALQREGLSPLRFNQVYAALSGTHKPSFYQEEEIDLASILDATNSDHRERALRQHAARYAWINNSYYKVSTAPLSEFKKRLRQLQHERQGALPATRIERNARELRRARAQALSSVRQRSSLVRIGRGVAHCIWWQDQRKKHVFQYLTPMMAIVRELERRAGVPRNTFDYAYFWEATIRPSRKLLAVIARRRRWLVTRWHLNPIELSGSAARPLIKQFWNFHNVINTRDLHGIPIYSGPRTIRGKVFIVRGHKDLPRFPSGRILVTTMTAPEYVIAMRKAAAIVTDTGGITCHAAIVARELRKPCIVGTKYATQVFKDSDMIEVDAIQGIVKKV